MKCRNIQYYVEGEDDKKVVDTLRLKMNLIKTGKVHVLNVVEEDIPDMRLRALSSGTLVVLVFDTDTGKADILRNNLKKLDKHPSVCGVITIPQVGNLEDELVRSCNISKIEELLNSKSQKDFKRDILRITNLDAKLVARKFNIDLFWNGVAPRPYQDIANESAKVKVKTR